MKWEITLKEIQNLEPGKMQAETATGQHLFMPPLNLGKKSRSLLVKTAVRDKLLSQRVMYPAKNFTVTKGMTTTGQMENHTLTAEHTSFMIPHSWSVLGFWVQVS